MSFMFFFFVLPPKKAHFLVDIKRVDINEYRRIGHALIPGCICLSIPAQVKRINERKSSRKGGESVDKSRTSSVTTLKLVSLSSATFPSPTPHELINICPILHTQAGTHPLHAVVQNHLRMFQLTKHLNVSAL